MMSEENTAFSFSDSIGSCNAGAPSSGPAENEGAMSMTHSRLCALAFGLATGLFPAPSAAQAEPWPQRVVRLIVPTGAGSSIDVGARLFADRLTRRWGQPT